MIPSQRDALEGVFQASGDNPSCKINLFLVYTLDHGDRGVPLKSFHQTNNLEWVLSNNLAPINTDSVRQAIRHIRAIQTAPIPNFDLSIRYCDLRIDVGTSVDLVKIRYRPEGADNNRDLHSEPSGLEPSGILYCEFNTSNHKDLHRHAWICNEDRRITWVRGEEHRARLEKLQEDYEKAFPVC